MTPKVCCSFLLMLALLVLAVKSTVVEQCGQTYQSSGGLTCFFCAPGTYKVKDCTTSSTGALCMTCPKGSYEENCNIANHCEPCHLQCRQQFTEKVKDCTLYKDTECQCVEGRYRFNETDTDWVCLSHNPCMIGYGMVNLGTPHHDTQCEKCIAGETFSSTDSFERCTPCTKCEVYKTLCSIERDAGCLVAGTNRSTSAASKSTQKTELLVLYIVIPILVLFLAVGGLIWWHYERIKRCCPMCHSEEDGTKNKDHPTQDFDNPQRDHSHEDGGPDGGQDTPNTHEDQNGGQPHSTAPISGTQDFDNPPRDSSEDDGAEGGQDSQNTHEDQNGGQPHSTAPISGDPQNGGGATTVDEGDMLDDTKEGQREDECSRLHATEEGGGSMNKMLPIPDNPYRPTTQISQPTESIAHPHFYNSSEFEPVHAEDVRLKMDDLKESNSTEQGGKELDPLNSFGDSFI